MQKVILILLGIFVVLTAHSQETTPIQVIKGKVVDESSNPVSYTNIGLEGTFYGTASDADGNFELKVPGELASRQVFFSAVGYKNRTYNITGLVGKDFNLIKLTSQSYNIGDIDISAQSKVLYRIIRTASEKIPRNFSDGPFNLDCSYELEKNVEGEIFSINAGIKIYDKSGYSLPSVENAYNARNYSFSGVQMNFEPYLLSDGAINFDEVIELDLARSVSSILNPVVLNRFVLNQEDDARLNGIDVWVIGFELADPGLEGAYDLYASRLEGKIYINKNNYEVNKIEGWVKSQKQNRAGKGLAVAPGSNSYLENVKYDFVTTYNSEGLEFIKLHKEYTLKGKKVNEISRLIVNEVNKDQAVVINSRDYYIGE